MMVTDLRVLHLTRDLAPLTNGGISTAVRGMVSALQQAGLVCPVISFDDWRPKSKKQQVESPPVWSKECTTSVLRLTSPAQLPAMYNLCEAWDVKPDVIHVHNSMLWDVAQQLRRFWNVPVIKSIHVLQERMNAIRGIQEKTHSLRMQNQAIVQADWVIAPSQWTYDHLCSLWPSRTSRLSHIGLGLQDTQSARLSVANRMLVRGNQTRELTPMVLYVGRFEQVKGTQELIQTIAQIARIHPTVRFVLAGGVVCNPRTERRWLRRFQNQLGALGNRVEFVGWLSEEELSGYYSQASVLIHPSRFETFGLSVAEAMLHGLCVSATKAPGVCELIQHEQTGLLCDVLAVDQLVSNTLNLLRNPSLATTLGQHAAHAIRQHHLWSHKLDRLVDLYRRLVSD